jgi:hypothetical protein
MAMLPVAQARMLTNPFALARAPQLSVLAAVGEGQHQGPEVVGAGDRLAGQHIPGRQILLTPTDGQSQHMALDQALINGIPRLAASVAGPR